MGRAKLRKCIVSWVAVFSLLVAALAPSIALALGSMRGDTLVEVCTAQGSQWIKIDPGSKSDPFPAGWNAGHCKLCCSHAPAVGLPPAADAPLVQLLEFGHELPDAFVDAPRTLHAWVSAQPRAPPL